jgi:hypothetical protein
MRHTRHYRHPREAHPDLDGDEPILGRDLIVAGYPP